MTSTSSLPPKAPLNAPGIELIERMMALAAECDAVNLVQGHPDFDGPELLARSARSAVENGRNQYTAAAGIPELKRIIARSAAGRGIGDYDPDGEVVITVGCTAALSAALRALVAPGDEVIMFEPFWHLYQPLILDAGGIPVVVPLSWREGQFELDPARLDAAIGARTRLILLNTPHNPTGKIFSRDELRFLADRAIDHDLFVISDEVYEFLTFDGIAHESIAAIAGMRQRTVVVSSASKTLSITGWRVGWAMGPRPLIRAVLDAHILLSLCAPTPLQFSLAETLDWAVSTSYLTGLREQYARKRDLLFNALTETGFHPTLPKGGFFMLAKVPCNTAEETNRYCDELTRRAGVAMLPAHRFFEGSSDTAGAVRVSFGKQDASLVEAARRLEAWQGEVSSNDARGVRIANSRD